MKVKVIRCEEGLYMTNNTGGYCNNRSVISASYRFNKGEFDLVPTWNKDWVLLKGADSISSYEKKMTGSYVNPRWELRDKEDNPLGLPETLSVEDAYEGYCEDDYDYYIGSKSDVYKHRFYYSRIRDKEPDYWEESEFEVEDAGYVSVEEVDNFKGMKVTLLTDRSWGKDNTKTVDLSSIAEWSQLEKILTPPLAIHNRPCSLTSEQTYQIIRAYVKENINGLYASVTSDYDFCFTIKKRVRIKPYTVKTEVKKSNGRSYAKPRFSTKEVSYKEVEIFEMTHAKRNYKGYTIIKGFEGDSLEDLAIQIKVYLEHLMDVVNAPLHECEHCDGLGHVVKPLETNKRQEHYV